MLPIVERFPASCFSSCIYLMISCVGLCSEPCIQCQTYAEICEDKPYNSMSDVWGLGCILYEMATLKRAFEGNSLPALVTKILRGRFNPIPSRYSMQLRSLIHSMLARNPNRRPTVETILKLPWMRRRVSLPHPPGLHILNVLLAPHAVLCPTCFCCNLFLQSCCCELLY